MQLALSKQKNNSGEQRLSLNLADDGWEIETITSAVKVQQKTFISIQNQSICSIFTDFPARPSRAANDVRAAQQIHQCRQNRRYSTEVSAINSN